MTTLKKMNLPAYMQAYGDWISMLAILRSYNANMVRGESLAIAGLECNCSKDS